ncbi:MAG TPA: TlpA disulfide reductase family protein [Gemmatimonadales bacterium]|nr:TlpA disulfide reductase family protein [Gemmatimonadales bacterium]
MKTQWIAVAVVVVILGAGVVLGLKLKPEIFPVAVGSTAPSFVATDLATGRRVTLADFKGQVVLLNIWATWCEPCKVEMPSLEQLQKDMGPAGLKIVAVSIDEGGPDAVRQYARDLGLTFDILHDQSGHIQQIYQTTGVPESFIINRAGTIEKKVIGATDWDATVNKDLVRRLLAQAG